MHKEKLCPLTKSFTGDWSISECNVILFLLLLQTDFVDYDVCSYLMLGPEDYLCCVNNNVTQLGAIALLIITSKLYDYTL